MGDSSPGLLRVDVVFPHLVASGGGCGIGGGCVLVTAEGHRGCYRGDLSATSAHQHCGLSSGA